MKKTLLAFIMFFGVMLIGTTVNAKSFYKTEFQMKAETDIYNNLYGIENNTAVDNGETTSDNQDNIIPNDQSNTSTESENLEQTTTCVLTKGMKETYYLNMDGKVTWSVGNKKVAKLTKKSDKKCVIKGLKNGKTTIIAKTATQTLKIKVTVKSGDAFVNAWCANWVKVNVNKDMNRFDKMLLASYYMNVNYSYGSTSSVKDVIVKKKGTCVSGGKLLVKLLNKMGFKAQLRFAAKDKMSRYPSGIYFASQHHNVKVTSKGKTYYIDGTPATGFIYLSNSKKPLYYAFVVGGGLIPVLDELN